MKIKLITYANKSFLRSQQLLKKSALIHGVDEVILYNDIWLKSNKSFYKNNRSILDNKRGAGYWLWKPYIILDALGKMSDNDILIYLDSGTLIIDDVHPLVRILKEQPLILFHNSGQLNKSWTKRDCFYYMNCDEKNFHDGKMVVAGYILMRKTPFVINIITAWLRYAVDIRIISDQQNVSGLSNLEAFIDHRHDQSILSNLAIKYDITLFRDPSQWGNYLKLPEFRKIGEFLQNEYSTDPVENSTYPTIFEAHKGNASLTVMDLVGYYFQKIKQFL